MEGEDLGGSGGKKGKGESDIIIFLINFIKNRKLLKSLFRSFFFLN